MPLFKKVESARKRTITGSGDEDNTEWMNEKPGLFSKGRSASKTVINIPVGPYVIKKVTIQKVNGSASVKFLVTKGKTTLARFNNLYDAKAWTDKKAEPARASRKIGRAALGAAGQIILKKK
jgi:hypothetical protein